MSPSAFLKPQPRPSALKSGSRAQQAPDGAQIGFASAGSLWKINELEHAKRQDDQATEQNASHARSVESKRESTGKLVKPKKTTKRQQDGEPPVKRQKLDDRASTDADEPATRPKKRKTKAVSEASAREDAQKPRSMRANFASDANPDAQPRKDDKVGKPASKPKKKSKKAVGQDGIQSHAPKDHLPPEAVPSRPVKSPTVNLGDFAQENPANTEIARTSAKDVVKPVQRAAQKPKKSRKSADDDSKTRSDAIEAPVKKPRKRKKKSESIILNSDEPEMFNGPATTSNYFTEAPPNVDEAAKAQPQCVRTNTTQLEEVVKTVRTPHMPDGDAAESIADDAVKSCLEYNAREQSNYFSLREELSIDTTLPGGSETREQDRFEPTEKLVTGATIISAPSKRRQWTPVKDSIHTDLTLNQTNTNETYIADFDASAGPKRQLSDVLGGLAYVSTEAGIVTTERAVTGEALTKRRRIELAPHVGNHSVTVSPNKVTEPNPAMPVKQKKERKKAQTITALATAAFQPPKEAQTDDGTLSHFFSPSKPNTNDNPATDDQPKQKVKKPRKARKPKEKTNTAASNAKPNPSKPKKAKAKFNEADYMPKLYSPGRATAQLKSQGFLFGTSSQLAMDEPASFIGDMQVAIQQAEQQPITKFDRGPASSQMSCSQAQQSPQGKSCVRVPTAPHGTCLSIEQARRELWCASTRDLEGSVLRSEDTLATKSLQDLEQSAPVDALPALEDVLELDAEVHVKERPFCETEGAVFDLCNTSPIVVQEPLEPEFSHINSTDAGREERDWAEQPAPERTLNHSDDWMFIESSSPLPAAQPIGVVRMSPAPVVPRNLNDAKLLSPRRFRPPLSPLNPNTLMTTSWASERGVTYGQTRALSSTAIEQGRKSRSKSPGKRGPGRPRKDSTANSPSPNPPKRRGRPPKSKTLSSEPSQLPKPKKQKIALSACQPIEETGFIDIDDIYDSDSPATPSPPRRRATSSPPTVQPLTLSLSNQAKAPAAVTALKSKDSHWADIRSDLFDRTMAVIKSLPPSNNASKPTWYEKILLYDPIVLEDLTAWLNDQGLRVETKKQKAKPKKKGRKRKDADAVDEQEAEWEVQYEPLQAWMVQKFCEEKSICCLWREGLRGGVKTKY